LAEVTKKVVDNFSRLEKGIYHVANSGICSWYELCKATLELKGIKTPVTPITTEEYPTPARRPKMSALDCKKIESALEIKLSPWREALSRVISRL
jgi:dTDP-4-dehydrorhamnose reductase